MYMSADMVNSKKTQFQATLYTTCVFSTDAATGLLS
jgi:hypothetical protein